MFFLFPNNGYSHALIKQLDQHFSFKLIENNTHFPPLKCDKFDWKGYLKEVVIVGEKKNPILNTKQKGNLLLQETEQAKEAWEVALSIELETFCVKEFSMTPVSVSRLLRCYRLSAVFRPRNDCRVARKQSLPELLWLMLEKRAVFIENVTASRYVKAWNGARCTCFRTA